MPSLHPIPRFLVGPIDPGSKRLRIALGQRVLITLIALLGLGAPMGASAVVLGGTFGFVNTAAPIPDPGFGHVGTIGSNSGVYLRNGWVLTANHVGVATIDFEGVGYAPVPNSRVRLTSASGAEADLILFKLLESPPLPDLILATGPRSVGEEVYMIGNGRNRKIGVLWTGPNGTPFLGWSISQPHFMRWGLNEIDEVDQSYLSTTSFTTRFDELPGGVYPEAQGVAGDSGGAAFHWNGTTSELVGLMFARAPGDPEQSTQPQSYVLFDNLTAMADLWVYRDQIEAIIDQPDCDNGLDDDGDGQMDFPADTGCAAPSDLDEVPEPGVAAGLLAGGLTLLGRRRPSCA